MFWVGVTIGEAAFELLREVICNGVKSHVNG
jgi:hypothetical protein